MQDTGRKVQIRAAVITVSDSRHEDDDVSGVTLVGLLLGIGAEVAEKIIVTDDEERLAATLGKLADEGADGGADDGGVERVNLIVTTGGTGFAARDRTPEATRRVIEREAPGLAEAMRLSTLKKTPTAMLARGVCGIRGKCLIVNLPGSPNGVLECFEIIKPVLQHAVNQLEGETAH